MVFAYRTIVSKHILYQGVRINTGTLGQPFITLGQIDAVTLHPCRNPSEVLAEGFAVREVYFIVEFVVFAVEAEHIEDVYVCRACSHETVHTCVALQQVVYQ